MDRKEKRMLTWVYACLDEMVQGVLKFDKDDMDEDFVKEFYPIIQKILELGRDIKKVEVSLDEKLTLTER